MVACAVATCRLRPKSKKFVSFYQFPKDEKLKRMWVEACKRKDLKVKDIKPGHRICSMHFTADCFNYHLTYDNVKLLLKPMSCPTLNLPRLHSSTRNSISYEDHIEKLIPVQDFMRREVTFTNEPGSDILSVTSSNERSISHCDTLDGAKVQSTSPFVTPDGAQGLSTSHSHQEDQFERRLLHPAHQSSRTSAGFWVWIVASGPEVLANAQQQRETVVPSVLQVKKKDTPGEGLMAHSPELLVRNQTDICIREEDNIPGTIYHHCQPWVYVDVAVDPEHDYRKSIVDEERLLEETNGLVLKEDKQDSATLMANTENEDIHDVIVKEEPDLFEMDRNVDIILGSDADWSNVKEEYDIDSFDSYKE